MKRSVFVIIMFIIFLYGCTSRAPAVHQPLVETPLIQFSPTVGLPTIAPTIEQTVTPVAITAATVEPTDEPELTNHWIAYIDEDRNLALVNFLNGEQRLVTEDAAPYSIGSANEGPTISYCCAKWSSDGRFLAFWQEIGTPVDSGYQYNYRLSAFDFSNHEFIELLRDEIIAGYDWRPESYEIAYGLPIAEEYFLEDREAHATGINRIDVVTGRQEELILPENGLALVGPIWSRDGRYLSFSEILYMEGSGQFAFYDFAASQYHSTGEVIGDYSLSPTGETIAYDRLSYMPTGEEQIWIRELAGAEETPISLELAGDTYAFSPLFSPDGQQIAYFTAPGGPETLLFTLNVYQIDSGETIDLGAFEQGGWLGWSPDSQYLTLATGPYEERRVVIVNAEDGSVTSLVSGSEPAWRP